jgi:hypothetical protein
MFKIITQLIIRGHRKLTQLMHYSNGPLDEQAYFNSNNIGSTILLVGIGNYLRKIQSMSRTYRSI